MRRKGRHPSEALTGHFVHTAQVSGLCSDGGGLFLRVDALRSQRWVLCTMVKAGAETSVSGTTHGRPRGKLRREPRS
jgi:hypothetical protein